MPELPEVEALARFLSDRLAGQRVADLALASLSALKTYSPPITALLGLPVAGVLRHGKFLDLATEGGPHLVWHLSRAGWVQWRDEPAPGPVKPGKGPLALRLGFVNEDGEPTGRIDLTEAGTQKRLAVYVVGSPRDVPGVARLGPDALGAELTEQAFAAILAAAGRAQVKGVLRDQSIIAGIGNAYSDEILHAARLSPFHPCSTLSADEVAHLYDCMRQTLLTAVANSVGHGTGTLKAEKRASMAVHGRAGQPCPVCESTVLEVSFADSALQYCPTCQTGGKPLADRRMSRLLK
ncbi:MAG: DNA-formamidopyrimidine glycosylase family protein [Actinomycetota bacterium]|nr:DNA-formamidopyrimidine glycosylase family protein [Actinomycetota bacterium]